MRSRWSQVIFARGSPGVCHSGSATASSSLSFPCRTRMPTSALATLLLIDQPSSGVSLVNPSA
jgi:hypothetical protein